jgi:hypothetical protein
VTAALTAAGVRSVLLKGPVLERALYGDGALRLYADVDLLVAPGSVRDAEGVVGGLGFERPPDEALREVHDLHAVHWVRPHDAAWVDLHWTVKRAGAPPERVWEALAEGTQRLELFGTSIEAPRPAALALVVALHAAQHGAGRARGIEDLERAAAHFGSSTWEEAAGLARRVEALDAFAAGMRLAPGTAAIADRLGLAERAPLRVTAVASTQPETTHGWYRILRARGLRARLRLLRQELFPHPAVMRERHPKRSGTRAGLAWLYASRPLVLAARAPRALLALWRAARNT